MMEIAKHDTVLSDREKAILAVAMEYLKRDFGINAVDKTLVIQVATRPQRQTMTVLR